jgi:hypothetical protein
MADFWQRVQELQGKTLLTLARQRPFRVVSVSSDRVEFVPENGNGNVRWFPRKDIELIAGLGLARDEIRPRLQQEWPSCQNTSYVASIVHEITKPQVF